MLEKPRVFDLRGQVALPPLGKIIEMLRYVHGNKKHFKCISYLA